MTGPLGSRRSEPPSPRRSAAWAQVTLLLSASLGLGFFLLPIPVANRWTVPFDAAVRMLLTAWPEGASAFTLGVVGLGALGSLAALSHAGSSPWRTGPWLVGLRLAAVPLAVGLWGGVGPAFLLSPSVGGVVWDKLAVSIAVIIPLGAVALQMLTAYGLLEIVGAWMRPVMRPLFGVPGRAALDGLMSWIGSYSVGLYLSRLQMTEGRYTRRETFRIVTGFSTVSIGFVGVVAHTLDLLTHFPWLVLTWFSSSYGLAALLARTWPASTIPDVPVRAGAAPPVERSATAWSRAVSQARAAPPLGVLVGRGLVDGVVLASTLVGTVLLVGTGAVLVAEHTPVFSWLGAPVAPVLAKLGVPDRELVAPAVLAGITEVYVPALLVGEASEPARFFVAALSLSQLVFFSSVAPMMVEMFREVPIRVTHLVALFAIRTVLLVPALAAVVSALTRLGVLTP